MKQKQDSNTEQGHRANTLLYAVAPTPKLSTDLKALDFVCRNARPLNWCDLVVICQPLNP
jgi:hypothetical protein